MTSIQNTDESVLIARLIEEGKYIPGYILASAMYDLIEYFVERNYSRFENSFQYLEGNMFKYSFENVIENDFDNSGMYISRIDSVSYDPSIHLDYKTVSAFFKERIYDNTGSLVSEMIFPYNDTDYENVIIDIDFEKLIKKNDNIIANQTRKLYNKMYMMKEMKCFQTLLM